jgi:hypothetical protein
MLTEFERSKISNSENYLAPCQVEIIWIDQPEFQTMIISNFPERNDREVIVSGPFKLQQLIPEIENILAQPRWSRPVAKNSAEFGLFPNDQLLRDPLSRFLVGMIGYIQSSILREFNRPSLLYGLSLHPNVWADLYAGNVANLNHEELIKNIIENTKGNAARAKASETRVVNSLGKVPESEKSPPRTVKGMTAYFYPPIVVGELPKPQTFIDLFYGTSSFLLSQRAFEGDIGHSHVIVDRDGLVEIAVGSVDQAIRMLNVIFAMALLHGVPAISVREGEIGTIQFDPKSWMDRGFSMPISSLRTMLYEERFSGGGHPRITPVMRRTIVSIESLTEILQKCDKVISDNDKASELIFWLEAITHLNASEYPQSFVMSWLIIEKFLSGLWLQFLGEKKVFDKRGKKLGNPNLWSIDSVIESLNLSGMLDDNRYALLMDLKTKRNRFVHRGWNITKEYADKCIVLATSIVRDDLSALVGLPKAIAAPTKGKSSGMLLGSRAQFRSSEEGHSEET